MGKKPGITDAQLAAFNLLQRERFIKVPTSGRMLFLPHCLRKAKGCRGETTEAGLVCKHCNPGCSINRLSTYAESKGYHWAAVPGGAMVFNLIEKHHPKAIVGVACHHEIAQAAERISGGESDIDFAYQGVALSKTGCVDTMVDEEEVRKVLDLVEAAPVPAAPAPAPAAAETVRRAPAARPLRARLRPLQTARARRFAGVAAGVTVALVAALLFMPQLLTPITQPGRSGGAALAFYTIPSARFVKDSSGNTLAEVKAAIFNSGPGTAHDVSVRVTSLFCARPYLPSDGGMQLARLNRTMKAGSHEDVSLLLKAHCENDTAFLVETLLGGAVVLSEYVKPVKPVFISNAGVTGYLASIASGREANISVQVFNEKGPHAPETLKLVVESYSSFNKNTHWDSAEVILQTPLARNETWTASVLVNVNELDPGHPSFVVELYEYSATSPADETTLEG